MPYLLALSVVLNGALVYGFLRFVSGRDKAHRVEVDRHREQIERLVESNRQEIEESRTEVRVIQADLSSLVRSHAEQLERLDKSHRQEVATLCQRLQAPQIAVAEHMGQFAPPDPPNLDLEDDGAVLEEQKRRMQDFLRGDDNTLQDFAEELAAEH